jgi:ribonuclease P protein component
MKETFHKSERLCSKKVISFLFEKGNSLYTPLFKVVWTISPEPLKDPAQVAFSVSKRNFRKAIHRNLIKRRLREAYRKNKYLLYNTLTSFETTMVFIIIFRGNKICDFQTIEKSMIELLAKLDSEIRESNLNC